MSYGQDGNLGICFQDSGNAVLVNSVSTIPFISEGIEFTPEDIMDASMPGHFDEGVDYDGPHKVTGNLDIEAHPITMGWLFKSVLGQVATTSDTNLQTHVFEPLQADWDNKFAGPPMTIEVDRGVGSSGLYFGMVGNDLTITAANQQLLKVSAGFMGVGFDQQEPSTPVYPTVDRPFKWDQSSMSFGGAAVDNFRSVTWKFTNNLEQRWNLEGGLVPGRIQRTAARTIEVTGTVEFDSTSMWTAFRARSELPFVANFTSNQSPNTLLIDIPKLRLTTYSPVISGEGRIEVSFTGKAKYLTTSLSAARITLSNTQEYY